MQKMLRVLLLNFLVVTFFYTSIRADESSGWRSWVAVGWAVGATITTACAMVHIRTLTRQLREQKTAHAQSMSMVQSAHQESVQQRDVQHQEQERRHAALVKGWLECEADYKKKYENLAQQHNYVLQQLDDFQPKRNCTQQAFKWIESGNLNAIRASVENIDFGYQDLQGRTVLHHSLLHKQYSIFNVLLTHTPLPHINMADTNNATPLSVAAEHNCSVEVPPLIDKRADLNVQARGGATALMVAAVKGHGNVVKKLLDAKADTHYKNDQGQTALDLARAQKHSFCADLLQQADSGQHKNTPLGGILSQIRTNGFM